MLICQNNPTKYILWLLLANMRTSGKSLSPSLLRQIKKTFVQTVSDLKSPEELEIFLKDFFTASEFETYAKRLATAYWLKKGRSYENIKRNLKVSSATIAEVSAQLETKGYKEALKQMEAEEWANKWNKRIRKYLPVK